MSSLETSFSASLDAFFRPRSVAILGASANSDKLGYQLVANMRASAGERHVYPISRSRGRILDYEVVPSVRELPEPPDLLLISIPAEGVPKAIEEAVSVGARAAVILSCGFAEAGTVGRALQQRVLDVARPARLRIIGPNCMGVCDLHQGLIATYFSDLPSQPGRVGFISQSGAFGGMAFAHLYRDGVGISKFASIGNMADVSHAELVRYFGADEETRVIAAFIEGVPNGAELLDAISDVSRIKPIVILKGGRTEMGRAAAVSHTGSLAGEGRVWDALLQEAGALVAEGSEDLFDAAVTLARCEGRPAKGNRLAIVTISGGPSVVAADVCERYGLALPNLESDLAELKALVPEFASLRNPVDLSAQTAPSNYERAVSAVAAQPTVDAILAVNVGLDLPEFGHAFVRAWQDYEKPITGYLVGGTIEELFAQAGIPNLPSIERSVRALSHLHERTRRLEEVPSSRQEPRYVFPRRPLRRGVLTEHEAKQVLAEHGIRVTRERLVQDRAEALSAAEDIGYPVVLKVASGRILHKTDVGGLFLGLTDERSLERAYEMLAARFPGESMLVQELVRGDLELILGGRRDPLAGPIVMVGIGGILTEVLEDVAFCRVPVSHDRALSVTGELRGQSLLDGFRGAPPVDRGALADLIERLSALLAANPDIAEVDLNPIIASGAQMVVVDALVRTGPDAPTS